ncbi:hypothetical protein U1Q18_030165 [Sarracenia purpurea var. burkii]
MKTPPTKRSKNCATTALPVQHHKPPPLRIAIAPLRAQCPVPPQRRPCALCQALPLCRRSLHVVSPIVRTPLSVAHRVHSAAHLAGDIRVAALILHRRLAAHRHRPLRRRPSP